MEREHEVESMRQARAELARLALVILDRSIALHVDAEGATSVAVDDAFLEDVVRFVELTTAHLVHCGQELDAHDTWPPPPPPPAAAEKCLVCGHFHGGQGACITSHAMVSAESCPTCVAEALR